MARKKRRGHIGWWEQVSAQGKPRARRKHRTSHRTMRYLHIMAVACGCAVATDIAVVISRVTKTCASVIREY